MKLGNSFQEMRESSDLMMKKDLSKVAYVWEAGAVGTG